MVNGYDTFSKLCEEHNVSAYKVSKDTGIAQSTLSEWKHEKYKPKIDKLCAIANYFEVPVTMLIEGKDT